MLWNAIGAFDYVATNARLDWYIAALSPEQLDYFDAFPTWLTGTWAIAIWFSVIGALCLLFKSRFAVIAFLVSLIAMCVTTIYNYILSPIKAQDVTGDFAIYFSILIFVLGVAQFVYARAMKRRGYLN